MHVYSLALGAVFSLSLLPFFPASWIESVATHWPLWGLLCVAWLFYGLKKRSWILFTLWGALFFSAWGCVQAHRLLSWEWPLSAHNQVLFFKGRVAGIVFNSDPEKMTVDLSEGTALTTEGLVHASGPIRWRLVLPQQRLEEGDRIEGWARWKSPLFSINPGGSDWEKIYFLQGVRAVGHLKIDATHPLQIIPSHDWSYRTPLKKFLQAYEGIGASHRGIMMALALGSKEKISLQDRALWQKTGVAHLLAISGMHVGGVAALIFFFLRQIKGLPLSSALFFSGISALLYSALTGFSVSTRRACWMILSVIGWAIFSKKMAPSMVYSVAILGVLLLEPLAPLGMAFWLSFGAVAVLMLMGFSARHAPQKPSSRGLLAKIKPLIKAQWWLFLGLMPLSLAFFHQISLGGLCANVVAIPLVSMIIVPLLLVVILSFSVLPSIAMGALSMVGCLLQGLSVFLEWVASWPGCSITLILPLSVLIFLCVGLIGLLWPRFPGRWLWAGCFIPLFFWSPTRPEPGEAWITVLDIGQGSATFIETQHHRMMVDFGPPSASVAIEHFLETRQIRHLDKALITHGDHDHQGGLAGLLSTVSIGAMYSGEPERVRAFSPVASCGEQEPFEWDGVLFSFFAPQGLPGEPRLSKKGGTWHNDRSCVLEIRTGEQRMVLTGDMTWKGEERLLQERALVEFPGSYTALLVPHHGSLSSSSLKWIESIAPQVAIMSAGCNNSYGLPHPTILMRYQEAGVETMQTAHHGAIELRLTGQGRAPAIQGFRRTFDRFWHPTQEERAARCQIRSLSLRQKSQAKGEKE